MRINIRLKSFLLIMSTLLITAVVFVVLSPVLLEKAMVEDTRRTFTRKYFEIRKGYHLQNDLGQYLRKVEKGLGGFITVFDYQFQILSSTSPELSHHSVLPPYHIRQIKNNQNDPDFVYKIYRYYVAHKVEHIGLIGKLDRDHRILLEKPISDVNRVMRFSNRTILVTIAVVIVIGIIMAFYFSLLLTRPIIKINKKAVAIAKLDFDYDLDIGRQDEIGDLGSTMNKISRKLQTTMQALQETNSLLATDRNQLEVLNRQLEELSTTDRLTKLANRLKIDQVLQDELYKAEVRGQTFSIIMLDLDHFKKINDTLGHQIGDKVLVSLAEILRNNTRQVDTVGRWGGEEFIIILPGTDLDGAMILADNLRKEIMSYDFEEAGNNTASFGVTQYVKGLGSVELIRKADEALYRVKESGRNRVEKAE